MASILQTEPVSLVAAMPLRLGAMIIAHLGSALNASIIASPAVLAPAASVVSPGAGTFICRAIPAVRPLARLQDTCRVKFRGCAIATFATAVLAACNAVPMLRGLALSVSAALCCPTASAAQTALTPPCTRQVASASTAMRAAVLAKAGATAGAPSAL